MASGCNHSLFSSCIPTAPPKKATIKRIVETVSFTSLPFYTPGFHKHTQNDFLDEKIIQLVLNLFLEIWKEEIWVFYSMHRLLIYAQIQVFGPGKKRKKKLLNYCTLSKAQNKLTTTTCNLASKFASGTAFIWAYEAIIRNWNFC